MTDRTSLSLAAIQIAARAASLLWDQSGWGTGRSYSAADHARWSEISTLCQSIALDATHAAWLGRSVDAHATALLALCDDDGRALCGSDQRYSALRIAAVAQTAVRGGAPLAPQPHGQPAIGCEAPDLIAVYAVRWALQSALGLRGASYDGPDADALRTAATVALASLRAA